MSPEATRAIYVRMPDRLARKLDRAAERLGASKRDVLAALVNDHLDVDGDNFVIALGSSRAAPAGPELGEPGAGEVLTLEETAELLRVEPGDVLALIEAGELPARLLGRQWRLSRTAVLAWLAGDGSPGRRARGKGRSR
jgi:excisionase family DNA binding protein